MPLRYTIDSFRSYTAARIVETGEIVEVNSRDSTARAFWKRRDELGLPMPANRDAWFENALCEALSAERQCRECKFVGEDAPEELKKERSFGLAEIWRFLKAMTAWVTSGCEFVDATEATRRAAICSQCPKNVDLPGCAGCSGVAAAIDALAHRTTPHDGSLKNCEACGCVNKLAVHFPLETVDTSIEYPLWCWKRPTPSDTQTPSGADQ